jgi:hypothetical protein
MDTEAPTRPHRKIKLTPKAIDLAETRVDPISNSPEDDDIVAESAIHNLLGPGKNSEVAMADAAEPPKIAGHRKKRVYGSLDYRPLDSEEEMSGEGDVQVTVSSSESDSDDSEEAEGES